MRRGTLGNKGNRVQNMSGYHSITLRCGWMPYFIRASGLFRCGFFRFQPYHFWGRPFQPGEWAMDQQESGAEYVGVSQYHFKMRLNALLYRACSCSRRKNSASRQYHFYGPTQGLIPCACWTSQTRVQNMLGYHSITLNAPLYHRVNWRIGVKQCEEQEQYSGNGTQQRNARTGGVSGPIHSPRHTSCRNRSKTTSCCRGWLGRRAVCGGCFLMPFYQGPRKIHLANGFLRDPSVIWQRRGGWQTDSNIAFHTCWHACRCSLRPTS
jgi:hypothetical protein